MQYNTFVYNEEQVQPTGTANCLFCLQRMTFCTHSRTRLTDRTHWPGWTRRTLPTNKHTNNEQNHKTAVIQTNDFQPEIHLRACWRSVSLTCSPLPPLPPFCPCSPTSPCINKDTSRYSGDTFETKLPVHSRIIR